MDEFPAGAASPKPRRPALSVVIPVRNGRADLECCLQRLRASSWTDYEVIVVDDGSTDGSGALAQAQGAGVVRHERSRGPASARNTGAEAARGPLIFFLDSDVAPHPEALARTVSRFQANPGLAALFGSYDDDPPAPGLVSQFRNLLHHHVHQRGAFGPDGTRPAHTFWTGCGAIRREVFLGLGGFDPQRYRRPAIEDIELGYRLTRAGYRVVLARDVLATHLKHWTLRSMIHTDVFQRGVPWALLILRSKTAESDLNVSPSQRASVAATGLGLLGALLAPWQPGLSVSVPIAGAAIVGLNGGFYRFLIARRGLGFALASVPLHALYFLCCGVSVLLALAIHVAHRGRAAEVGQPRGRRDRAEAPSTPAPMAKRFRRWTRWTRRRPRIPPRP